MSGSRRNSRVQHDDLFDAGHEPDAPAVISPEHVDNEEDQQPPSQQGPVYVPCQPVSPGATQAEVQLRYTEDGHLALVVYSDPETLAACCGEDQPWVAVPTNDLDALVTQTGADLIARDVGAAEESAVEDE